jgi:hypothetical protein
VSRDRASPLHATVAVWPAVTDRQVTRSPVYLEDAMKKLLALMLVLILSIAAFAATKRATLSLSVPVKVGNTLLAPGSYEIKYETGTLVQVNFIRDGKVIVTAPAQVIVQPSLFKQVAVTHKPGPDGTRILVEVMLDDETLKFSE